MNLLYRVVLLSLFFFFKQKTAYEVRISDWSSDVCSSDLAICDVAFVENIVPANCERPVVAGRAVRERGIDEADIPTEQLGRVFRIRRHGGLVGIIRPQCDPTFIGQENVELGR